MCKFPTFARNYKLLAIDVDGTLLDGQSRIGQKTLNALQAIRNHGIRLTLATGRFYPDACSFAKQIGCTCPMILVHGALVLSYKGEVIRQHDLPTEVIPVLIDLAQEEGVPFQIFQENHLVMQEKTQWNEVYLKYSRIKPLIVTDMMQYIKNKKNICSFIFLGSPETMDQLRKKVVSRLKDSISIALAHPNLLEIVAPGVSKGKALTELAGKMKIPLSEVIAIGDSYNDIEMIKTAGLGVVMGNAPQEVKDIADYITKDNNHNGIAYFISQLLAYQGSVNQKS